jgi:hypothetical protein
LVRRCADTSACFRAAGLDLAPKLDSLSRADRISCDNCMEVCRYAGMQVCRYAGMQVCRYAGMQVCSKVRISAQSDAHTQVYNNGANG